MTFTALFPEFLFPLDPASYSGADGIALDTVTTDGGLPSIRLDVTGSYGTFKASWKLTPSLFEEFMTFYNDTLDRGRLSFYMWVAFDYSSPQKHMCQFIPGTLQTSEIRGYGHTVSAELEIEPMWSSEDDETVMEAFEEYGFEWMEDNFYLLDQYVNVEAPRWIDVRLQ